jgi:hypothetical protein
MADTRPQRTSKHKRSRSKGKPPETVRIDPDAHAALLEIARAKHLTFTQVLTQAAEALRREVFFNQMAAGYVAMRLDEKAWAEEQAERALWDQTNADGLDRE